MAKYCGKVGFATQVQTSPGVWGPEIVEKTYYGDIMRNRMTTQSQGVNPNVHMSVTISVLSDVFIDAHIDDIRYITYKGKKWNVTGIEPEYPRVKFTIGEVYNETSGNAGIPGNIY